MKLTGHVKLTFTNVVTGDIEVLEFQNVIATTGKNSIASRLAGGTANNVGAISYMGIGTGTNVPAAGDTTLQTEILRKLISTRSSSGAVATFRTFFTTAEGNAALKEVGLFGDDATATANSGTLFARRAINRTKTSSETLTLEWSITIS